MSIVGNSKLRRICLNIIGDCEVGKAQLFKSLFNIQSNNISNLHLYSDAEKHINDNNSFNNGDIFKLGRFNYKLPTDICCKYNIKQPLIIVEIRYIGGLDNSILDRIRYKSYSNVDCIIACFSLINRKSFNNLTMKWLAELDKHGAGIPRLLVGTKADLILGETNNLDIISCDEGSSLIGDMGCTSYIETSSIKCINIQQCFDQAIKAAILYQTVNKIIRMQDNIYTINNNSNNINNPPPHVQACCNIQ